MKTISSYLKLTLASACLSTLMGFAAAQAAPQAEASGMPPLIPHDISSYQITPDMNACVMCHRKENSMAGATNISATHFTDTDGKEGDSVTKARYNCTACHAPAEAAK